MCQRGMANTSHILDFILSAPLYHSPPQLWPHKPKSQSQLQGRIAHFVYRYGLERDMRPLVHSIATPSCLSLNNADGDEIRFAFQTPVWCPFRCPVHRLRLRFDPDLGHALACCLRQGSMMLFSSPGRFNCERRGRGVEGEELLDKYANLVSMFPHPHPSWLCTGLHHGTTEPAP